jgi:hypothetical protein
LYTKFFDDSKIFYDNILFDGDKIFDDRTIDNTLFGDRQIFEGHETRFFDDGNIFL